MELELVQSLIQLVQNLSADLWQIAMRQVLEQAVECVFTLIICATLTILGARLLLHKAKDVKADLAANKYVDENWKLFIIVYFCILLLIAPLAYVASLNLIQYIVNPEYAALESLLRLVQQ